VRYENLLRRSALILRRYAWLWFFALFAGEGSSAGAGGSGSSGGIQQRLTTSSSTGIGSVDLTWVPYWLADRAGLIAEIALAILALALVWFLLSCLASGALIGAVARIDGGERVTFGAAWRIGLGAFWRVLGFKLAQFLLALLPALLLVIPPLLGAAAQAGSGAFYGLLLDLPLAVAYLYWLVFLGWLSTLALRACIVDGLGPLASFFAAFALLRRRFPRIALTTVVWIGVSIGIGIVLQVIYGFAGAPFETALNIDVAQGRWSELWGTVLAYLAVLVPVSLVVGGAVSAYYQTLWTVAYRRFDADGEVPEPPPLAA
jgi:hypothetical protein